MKHFGLKESVGKSRFCPAKKTRSYSFGTGFLLDSFIALYVNTFMRARCHLNQRYHSWSVYYDILLCCRYKTLLYSSMCRKKDIGLNLTFLDLMRLDVTLDPGLKEPSNREKSDTRLFSTRLQTCKACAVYI